ncbi:MAG: hypothetical protein HKN32_02565, partial [Flavobacteriales bacterium]|nr:hypothetical protein [Flavobacteriales bacterium]
MSEIDISYRGILKVAIPISLGSFVQFLVVITDNFFLSKVHMNAMNGAGNSALLYITLLMFAIGLSSAVQILVARRHGEGKFVEAGETLANGFWIMLLSGFVLSGILFWANHSLLPLITSSPEVLDNMNRFLDIRALGLILYPIVLMIIAFYSGIARTLVMFFATLITAGVNIFLDWVLIFGNLGAPQLGLEGAAWATVSAEVSALIFLIFYLLLDKG